MQPVDKMTNHNLPGYQPRNFVYIDYVNELSFQHKILKVRCLHFVTIGVMLLRLF